MNEEDKKCIQNFNRKGTEYIKDKGADGRILKRIMKKQDVRM
jgi:hypothetical protein